MRKDMELFNFALCNIKQSSCQGHIQPNKNKTPSLTATFSVLGVQTILLEHTPNHFQKETRYWQESPARDHVRKIRAGSFKELWASRSTKKEYKVDLFAFSNHQDFSGKDTLRDCSIWNKPKKNITVISDLDRGIQSFSFREVRVGA